MLQYILLAGLAGFFLPLQALINARASALLTGPLSAAITNFAVGLIGLIAYILIIGAPLPSMAQIASVPLWAWTGGLLGAFFITAAAIVVPKLGTAGLFGTIIATQLCASLILDHFGVLHPAQPVSLARLSGAVFLLIGVYLILKPQA